MWENIGKMVNVERLGRFEVGSEKPTNAGSMTSQFDMLSVSKAA